MNRYLFKIEGDGNFLIYITSRDTLSALEKALDISESGQNKQYTISRLVDLDDLGSHRDLTK